MHRMLLKYVDGKDFHGPCAKDYTGGGKFTSAFTVVFKASTANGITTYCV